MRRFRYKISHDANPEGKWYNKKDAREVYLSAKAEGLNPRCTREYVGYKKTSYTLDELSRILTNTLNELRAQEEK